MQTIKKLILGVAMLLVAGVLPGSPPLPAAPPEREGPRPPNLLKNGDFTQGLKGWAADTYLEEGTGPPRKWARVSIDKAMKYKTLPALCIESTRPDNSMANQIVRVKRDTNYKITFMVKTLEIRTEGPQSACLGIRGTYEVADAGPAPFDWKKVTFLFNSYDRKEVEVGPHLGWHSSFAAGTAWFADIHMEEVEAAATPSAP